MSLKNDLEIYVHIPFCVRKCAYCDFLSFSAKDEVKGQYIEALISEINQANSTYDIKDLNVSTIYFGGGTPTILYADQIDRIMDAIKKQFTIKEDAEITIEVNPGTVDLYKLEKLKKIGFNRLSIGMQSADDTELKMLGRIHDYAEFEKCFEMARKAGFDNVNVDVMMALPNQSVKKLHTTLNKVIELNPEHISSYSLIIEEGTPFYEKYGKIEGPVVGEEKEREMYHMACRVLKQAGYNQYEISNFSKRGRESRHNSGYWRMVPYIGFGLGASSYFGVTRLKNVSDFNLYLTTPTTKSEINELSKKEQMEEFMFLGLRMMQGVYDVDFEEMFSKSIESVYGDVLSKLISEELIENEDGSYRLTRAGIDYGNYVFSRFLL